MEEVRGAIQPVANCAAAQAHDTSATATRETGGTKSILRLIRSTPASNPETGALRAEVEGLRLALSIVQEALREERSDKEHWRDEAKRTPTTVETETRAQNHQRGSPGGTPHRRGTHARPRPRDRAGETPELRNDFGRFSSASASALVGPVIRLSSSATKHPIWGRHATLQPGKLSRAGDGEREPRPAGMPNLGVVEGSPPAHLRAHPRQLDARRTNRHSR